jgi:two-component system sensor histidine kinase KdpD
VLLDALPVHDDGNRLIAGAGIWTDISEQRAAEEAREAFLGILSHELRTPITSILAGSNILSRRSLEAAEADLVADIGVEAERLHWLVENLLVLSRVERGADLRRSDPVLVQHVGRRVLAHEGSRWPDRQFEATIPVGLPAASGDEAYVEQILRNLLSNAAKYSPTGSRIDLVVAHEEDGVTIRVLDRGPGFAPSDLLRVFELFYRAPSAVKVAAGAGIGLYTSRVLAEAMGGRIWAANRTDAPAGTAESLGAEVGVWLPLSTLDPEV